MSWSRRLLCLMSAALTVAPTFASDAPRAFDPDIARLVGEMSPERLEKYVRALVGFGTRHSLSSTEDPKRGIGAARRWIRDTLQKCSTDAGGRLNVEFDTFEQAATPRIPKPATLVNVVATLPGTDSEAKSRTLVVSGHYDSMCSNVMNSECDAPGANDDGSGTALVMELACTFAKRRFPATLVFMTVAGEEQGLLGAAHWARRARDRDQNIEAMITNDIVGNAQDETGKRDASYVRLFAQGVPAGKELSEEWQRRLETGGENDSPPRALARAIRESAERYVPDLAIKIVYRRDRYLRGGDHIPFLAQGYAAVRFTEAHEDFRHQHQDVRIVDGVQYGDLPEFVDYAYLANVARVNAAALASLARAPAPPSGVRIETTRLENSTTLSWLANRETDLAGY
ncbi:MAG TPA: M28 family peptidase, partial [Casimicrobiaceae bacterium]|nr:M28 family peptidase [Casimicrobiaceae bacterium]